LYVADVSVRLREGGQLGQLAARAGEDPAFAQFAEQYASLTGHGAPGS
jgi:hypothetical protein